MAGFDSITDDVQAVDPPAIDETDPFTPLRDKLAKDFRSIVYAIILEGAEIIELPAGAAPAPDSSWTKFRVRAVIVNPITAGALALVVGTRRFNFDGAARSLVWIPFPLVIERGGDLSCVGADGRIYLVGDPE